MSRHFSLNAWHDFYGGEFTVIRAKFDWLRAGEHGIDRGWLALDLGLLGLHASLTFWPRGKHRLAMPSWEFEIGREHGEAGE